VREAHFFRSAVQLNVTAIAEGGASTIFVLTRNRWPLSVTA